MPSVPVANENADFKFTETKLKTPIKLVSRTLNYSTEVMHGVLMGLRSSSSTPSALALLCACGMCGSLYSAAAPVSPRPG